ncbi:hypothetical protein GOV14_06285 [Candidatus Pacearchaeota archaeon]|nr:hypothetical protein [Candidatus Pacearchaeota archaeon]
MTQKNQTEMLKEIEMFPKLQEYLSDRLCNYKGTTISSLKKIPDSDLVTLSLASEGFRDIGGFNNPSTTVGIYEGETLYTRQVTDIRDSDNNINRRGNRIFTEEPYEGEFAPYSNIELLENTPKEAVIRAAREDGNGRIYDLFLDKVDPVALQRITKL